MAESNKNAISYRRIIRRIGVAVGVALLLYGVASLLAIREARRTEKRAAEFLKEFEKLEPETSTLEQVSVVTARYGASWHNVSYRRDETYGGILFESLPSPWGMRGTQFEFTFSNRWLAMLRLAPPATFGGDVFVAGGRVVFRTVGFSAGRGRTYFVAQVDENVGTKLGDKGYSMLLEPSKTLIHLSPSVSRPMKERAYGFNLSCLSKVGGCKDAREVLPRIYATARQENSGHWTWITD